MGDYGLTPEQIRRIEDKDQAQQRILDLIEHKHGVDVRAIAKFMFVAGQLDANPNLATAEIRRRYECMVTAFRHLCGIVDEENARGR